MTHSQREFLRWAATLGWRLARVSGSGHLRLRHHNGATVYVACTPSDQRAVANNRALLRRLARTSRRVV